MKCNGLKVGDKVSANGYDGRVIRLCEWDDSLIEVRLPGGVICTCSSEVTKL